MSTNMPWQDAHLFECFTRLVNDLGRAGTTPGVKAGNRLLSLEKIFSSYVEALPKPLPAGIGKHIFRLLYPHEGCRRRYGFKETTLVRCLEDILGSRGLSEWDKVDRNGAGAGCLGFEVQKSEQSRTTRRRPSRITISEVDRLLDKLARASEWSQMSQDGTDGHLEMGCEPRKVLVDLFVNSQLSPAALAVLTQIILRDLRPLLMPLPKPFNINSFADPKYAAVTFGLATAMEIWDYQMPTIYVSQCGDLDYACDRVEILGGGAGQGSFIGDAIQPILGRNILIPKCAKGRSVKSALKMAIGRAPPPNPVIWAETKYDGERMQIHVDISRPVPAIKIFSKSTRDSSLDRLNAHAIILSALGVSPPADLPRHRSLDPRSEAAISNGPDFRAGVILEAELVPYNESKWEGGMGPGIEEFWKLNYEGIKMGRHQESGTRHLHIAFFDIIYRDGRSLLSTPYSERHAQLEEVVREIPGFTRIAHRKRIDIGSNVALAEDRVAMIFEESSKAREEGLVLKAEHSLYNSHCPWVKLKRDYIPNLGDCVDLVCVAAGWDIDRARDLRVDTSVYTSFYLGVCTNKALVRGIRSGQQKPHFEVLFRVSWGLDRQQIVDTSMRIHHRDPAWAARPYERNDPRKTRLQGLSYTFHLPEGIPPPSAVFDMPRAMEVMGAGFQKLPKSQYYELRWPRLQKIYDIRERPWTDALDGPEYLQVARLALGYNGDSHPSPNSLDVIWSRSMTVACYDIISSPEKSTISPRRTQNGYLKTSPPSPMKTFSLSGINPFKATLAASTALQTFVAEPRTTPQSLPPIYLSPTKRAHQTNSPRRTKKSPTPSIKYVHERHAARMKGLVLALNTGMRRRASRPLPRASLSQSKSSSSVLTKPQSE